MSSENGREEIDALKSKIRKFTFLMEEIADKLNVMFIEGREKEFQEVVMEMLQSLERAQYIVKEAYYLAMGDTKGSEGSGGGP